MSSTPGAVPPEVQQVIDAIGVTEVDPLAPPAASSAPASSGLFVTGARAGGSPFLNLLTGATTILTIAVAVGLVVGLGYGGRAVLRTVRAKTATGSAPTSPTRAAAEQASVAAPGALQCAPGELAARDRSVALADAPAVVLGTKALPRDAATLASIGATSSQREGVRTDVFHPDGHTLAVRYTGDRPAVTAAIVYPARPQATCALLELVHVVTAPTAVHVTREGDVYRGATGSTPLMPGLRLQLRRDAQGRLGLMLTRQ